MDIANFSPEFLDTLTQSAQQSSRQRQHKNIHQHYNEPCQRLFNAIGIDSYIRPHRHSIEPKDECLIAVRGCMALLVFDDIGQVQQIIRFGAQADESQQVIGAGVNLPAGHGTLSLQKCQVLYYLKLNRAHLTLSKLKNMQHGPQQKIHQRLLNI